MLKNYFTIAVRNLMRNKIFSLINISGLAVGITCFIILGLFVLDENGFDNFNDNKDQIYRVLVHFRFQGIDQTNAKSCPPLGTALKDNFPEVINYARIGYFGQHNLRFNDKVFREGDIYTADSSYFDIFNLPFLYGDKKNSLRSPNTVVISETASKKYFGDINPVGKSFIVDNSNEYLITGVMKDFPKKSHFSCNFLLSMSTYEQTTSQDWLSGGYTTYLLMKEGIDINEFNNKMKNVARKNIIPLASSMLGIAPNDFIRSGNVYEYLLQPLASVYLRSQTDYKVDSNTEWGNERISNITYSYIFLAVGSFILLIAIFNFMNLATAKSEKRAREVGIRKTLGSDRSKLISQFLSESIFVSMISVVFSVLLTYLLLPYFNDFVNRKLSFNLFANLYTLPVLITIGIIVGLIAGSYPAFYLSSFQSAHILKGSKGSKSRKSRMRSILVIAQFAISITLIIGTITIKDQLDFIQNRNLGFNKEELIAINNGSVITRDIKTFQQEILNNPSVISSTASSLMFASGIPGNGYIFDKMTGSNVIPAQMLDVDYDFAKTYQLKLKDGRFFSREFKTDTNAVVINEAMVKRCTNWNPVGKNLAAMKNDTKEMIPYKIIGVIKDFNYESLHKTVRPLVLHLSHIRQASTVITIRVAATNINTVISSIENVWNKFSGREKMGWSFLNENLERMYTTENRIGKITTVFSLLAIIIACLGLFGLVSFITEQRTKEIGIRKVLGASVTEIVMLLSKEFTWWVLLANLIAWPVAYILMNNWLQNFAYRTEIGWFVFILAAIITLLIAFATVSSQTIKTALNNPVKSIRYE
jgi:putative ABC transport system permease protein